MTTQAQHAQAPADILEAHELAPKHLQCGDLENAWALVHHVNDWLAHEVRARRPAAVVVDLAAWRAARGRSA